MVIKKIGTNIMKLLVNAIIICFSASCVFPILWMINSSLRTNSEFMENTLALATTPHFENYVNAIVKSGILQSFFNSGLLSVLNVVFTIVFSFVIGYFVSRYDFRVKKVIYILFIAGMVVPVLSLLVPVFIQFKVLGLLDKRLSLLIPYVAFSMPFAVILMESYIKGIPADMDEAAYMEGCSTFQLLTRIIFPMCRPVISILVITSFMSAWNEFPFSLVLIKSEHLRTLSVAIRMFNSQYTIDYPLYMAALVVSIIPISIIYLLFSGKIVEGMTVGAVKG